MYNADKVDGATRQIITGYMRLLKHYRSDKKTRVEEELRKAVKETLEGLDMPENQLEALQLAIWLSCTEPKKHTFEKLCARYQIPVSRREFFRYKNRFYNNAAKSLGL